MNKKPSAKKSRTWLITGILCSAAVAYVFLIFLPGQRAIGEIRDTLKNKQLFILESERLSSAIQHAQEEVDQATNYTKGWRDLAPSENKLAPLFGQISDQAKLSGAKVVQLDPHPIQRLESLWRMKISVGFIGDYQQAFEFVRRMEQLDQVIWVDEVTISPESKDSQFLHGQIVLTIFADNREISD